MDRDDVDRAVWLAQLEERPEPREPERGPVAVRDGGRDELRFARELLHVGAPAGGGGGG